MGETIHPFRSQQELEARTRIDLKLHAKKVLLAHGVGGHNPADMGLITKHLEKPAHVTVTGRFHMDKTPDMFLDRAEAVIKPLWEVTSDDPQLAGLTHLFVNGPAYAMTGPDLNYATFTWLLEPEEGAEPVPPPGAPAIEEPKAVQPPPPPKPQNPKKKRKGGK